jgi:hypothetical protein
LRQSCYVAQAGLEFRILLPLPPECWDYSVYHHARLSFSVLKG